MITILVFVLIFLFLGGISYLVWMLHLRVESLAEKLSSLALKVKKGEDVVIENFSIVEKRFAKVDNEIKEISQVESKAKEALKAISRFQREDR